MNNAKPFLTFSAEDLEDRSYRITSLCYSSNGQDMLVSYSCGHLYLFELSVSFSISIYYVVQIYSVIVKYF